MLDILLYELALLSGKTKESITIKAAKLGISLQQMKDFIVENKKVPQSNDVQIIFKKTNKIIKNGTVSK